MPPGPGRALMDDGAIKKIKHLLISPTGKGLRSDTAGDGSYGARRGSRKHRGLDFLCDPGQPIVCPIDNAIITRINYPYKDKSYNGFTIENDDITIKLFYCKLTANVGEKVLATQKVAIAEDISKKWGDNMKPHVHLEIKYINPALFFEWGNYENL